ncbi:hypothetical protein GCM10011391_20570 [Pullulanibacillus camelliae]|uniref:Uncharacterized protein n=1 Tax=Pullulanibacillus camelliae TaxID=1707096 RepID=A0A8J2W3R9_9BACL|nr:hypothetical protein [Pullulanibacillus camelliae]GGE41705.1 hypothetical protein GCM10011391_20570 [Pullulanibacillus camelliae]
MASLFDDDYYCGHREKDEKKEKKHKCNCGCKTCICEQLRKLTPSQLFFIVPNGTNAPLDLGGLTTPTIFTFQKFDPETGCATFSYPVVGTTGVITQLYVTSCEQIQGLAFLTTTA